MLVLVLGRRVKNRTSLALFFVLAMVLAKKKVFYKKLFMRFEVKKN